MRDATTADRELLNALTGIGFDLQLQTLAPLCRGDLVAEPRITASALAHLLLCSRKLKRSS